MWQIINRSIPFYYRQIPVLSSILPTKTMAQDFATMRKGSLDHIPLTPSMISLMEELKVICDNPTVEAAFNQAVANVSPTTVSGLPNAWQNSTIENFVSYFRMWFTYLPKPSGGLGYIVPFTWFYLNNTSAYYFLNTFKSKRSGAKEFSREIFNWTVKFIVERGRFMDSKESLKYVDLWVEDPATKIEEFVVPKRGFKSFNEFFVRELNPDLDPPARPITAKDDDSIVVASADTIVNFILSDLTMKTEMNVKGRQLNVRQLLHYSKYAKYFEGGTAVSCVLMPGVYHRYHAPVGGKIVEGRDIPGVYNGIVDGEHWFNDIFNVGEGTTDFSIFEDFHRAYYIIETKKYGYVAMVPVGLNTISSMTPSLVGKQSVYVEPGADAVEIKKGQELGYFSYGGSLNILLFQKGAFNSVSVLQGMRLGQLTPPAEVEGEAEG